MTELKSRVRRPPFTLFKLWKYGHYVENCSENGVTELGKGEDKDLGNHNVEGAASKYMAPEVIKGPWKIVQKMRRM